MALFKEKMYCPVCKVLLGDRFKDELFYGHCEECKATFIWKYREKKPLAKPDSHEKVTCGCNYCSG